MFHDPREHPFVPVLEAAWSEIHRELVALGDEAFAPSPDSLTSVTGAYDETGWMWFGLVGPEEDESHRARCPRTVRACAAVPGLLNAGFSLFRPGTHLYPHRGERTGVLRCHLALCVPSGDLGIRIGTETRTWHPGRCLVFDDTHEHEAWNHGEGDRVVLIATYAREEQAGGKRVGPDQF